MEETPKELTVEELLELVERQEGEFLIRIDPEGEGAGKDAGTGSL